MFHCSMCHGHSPREWSRNSEEESETATEEPVFSEEEPAEDVDILTDGGDDE